LIVALRGRAPGSAPRYRKGWTALLLLFAIGHAIANMFLFAPTVLQYDGEPVAATAVRQRHPYADRPGSSIECILARPDGRAIAGALPSGTDCAESYDVIVSKHGLVDPVRA